MIELAEKVIEITKSKSKIIFEQLPADDPRQRKPDITVAETLIKWQPSVDLDTGIFLTAEYFHKELSV
jgi:UDP-glucuronate decarboxylase